MSNEYEFDAHIVVEWAGTKEYAAEKILEHCMDADIAISLHEQGTLNTRSLLAEVSVTEIKRKALWYALVDALQKDGSRLGEAQVEADTVMDRASASQVEALDEKGQ